MEDQDKEQNPPAKKEWFAPELGVVLYPFCNE